VVQLDADEGDVIWNEVVSSKPPKMKPEDVGMQNNLKGCNHMVGNRIDAG
jgi:hypothetical protein